MASPPIIPFALWQSGTNQNSVPANDNALRAEILQRNVNNATTAQPGSPSDGDTYIIQSTHTGAQWSTFTPKDLAIYKGGTWYAFTPVEGVKITVGGAVYVYTSGAWTAASGGGGGSWGSITGTLSSQTDLQSALDAKASISYVDSLVQGLSWKKAVRAATTANGALATAYENGDSIDGVTLATGDRILLKNQTTGSENGIYVVNASGAPTRATDADTGAELVNATTYVSEGATLADTQWTQTANAPITVGSTSLVFAQISAGGGALTTFSETLSTASPNNTVNVASLSITAPTATSATDAAIIPKGSGALLAALPDGTTTGGNKRGTRAVDLQLGRANANQVATGVASVLVGGTNNRVSNDYGSILGGTGNVVSADNASVVGGSSNTASGPHTSVIGGFSCTASGQSAFAQGDQCVADGVYSSATGYFARARGIYGLAARSSGQFSTSGDAQVSALQLRRSTTNATPAVLGSNGSAGSSTNQIVLPTGSTFKFRGDVVARNAANGDSASWSVVGLIKNVGGTVSLVGTPTVSQDFSDSGATSWILGVSADNTNKAIGLTVTGAAATTIKWIASIEAVELVG